ncbi:SMP-30/gluconolactonase/LRE family protein [Aquimarina sp. 2201CG14-23]|uniref:SMP-30/gluconolactonase/LRE family protein n=1 Tax=Aquimarina mycalae TaxID=3040073 RepID=UPI0024782CE6|nr:SMP-30/gluconolactonase/LRE family protein [Aquimarina sp. 2201CG14-23]MDH7448182.1 SMP-30/gluconolactonase/LRE family protein [Aquimarina sp. 2201CG14-23]
MKPTFISYHKNFSSVIGNQYNYQTLVETNAHEGPVYFRETNELYYTAVPESINAPIEGSKKVSIQKVCLDENNKIVTVQDFSNMANGMTMDLDHNLLICEQGTKTSKGGISKLIIGESTPKMLVDEWFGLPFNSTNDVVVKRDDGSIWFTDPAYGYAQGFRPTPLVGNYVYRFDPDTQQIDVVADSFKRPNGLAFSPDQDKMYINDSAAIQGDDSPYNVDMPHHIKVYDIMDGRFLCNERLFTVVTPGIPDGLKTDTEGRVYSSCATGIKVYSPKGVLLGEILADGVANFCFGGPENNILYICIDTAILEVQIAAVGAGDYN